jgi:hypothetical protein
MQLEGRLTISDLEHSTEKRVTHDSEYSAYIRRMLHLHFTS